MSDPKTLSQILRIVRDVQFPGHSFVLVEKGDGFLLRLTYLEADIDTGVPEVQESRQHYIDPLMSETEIVSTAFLCVMRSMEHKTREHFTYKGHRVQSPHFSISGRIEMCMARDFDGEEPR